MRVNRFLVCLLAGACLSSSVMAEPLSSKAADVFNARAGQMISAATSDPTDSEAYLEGMKSACNGLIGDLMSARLPNAYGIQLQSFCMGTNDLERAVKAKKTGRNAYCGDFDQGVRAARKMAPGGDTSSIYDKAQALADAAERVQSTNFITTKRVGWGLGVEDRSQGMRCKN